MEGCFDVGKLDPDGTISETLVVEDESGNEVLATSYSSMAKAHLTRQILGAHGCGVGPAASYSKIIGGEDIVLGWWW